MGVLFVVLVWGGVVSLLDVRMRIIPNVLSLPGVIITWSLSVVSPWWKMQGISMPAAYCFELSSVLGGVSWWALVLILGLKQSRSVGGGDAKLAASLGVITAGSGGVVGWLAAVGLSGVLSVITALLVARKRGVPQAPSMVGATLLVAMYVTVGGAL
ncbi:hypothetical protein GSS87_04340 [Corynebacterium sp. 4HC-13]|uniref:prepilin peptidase n=1 Tax=Corynebacterium anserum TaxID=2684406 RepID=UPI00163B2CE0|nr:prepilin peptidase [Corynebacterium anserum]MBC2681631.1 hypothetical protein [Corynebacterium anserum]